MEDDIAKFSLVMIRDNNSKTGAPKELRNVRDLTKYEVDSLNYANKILDELTASSPYKHFQDRYNDFFAKINEQKQKAASGKSKPHEFNDIYGKLDDLLSSFKGFEDKTKNLISQRYGKTSVQMDEFKTALSYEFDNTFEYRFSYNLRNYSQHKGSDYGKIRSVAELKDGKTISSLEIMLNSNKLLKDYSKWHSKVKQDLASLNSEFPLTPIIQKLKYACFRVYSKYLLSQEKEILQAIRDIKMIIGSYDSKIEGPTVIGFSKTFTKEGGTITSTSIKTNLIETIEPLLISARHYGSIK
ncbi:hypothetical protein CVV43_05155 [Candidatus Saccharibacteria bacterium HGW-Saccharibacteria-1]|jgi:hypothetical protein|nr:MAG: hypothetical protein CVV43_05155 [Candidatus Saccharibacteria bacterium HGW-Saccharibacteria-1]